MWNARDRLRVFGRRVWRRRGRCVGVAWVACVLGWIAVASLPAEYRSSAILLIETDGGVATDWDRVEGLAAVDVHRMLAARASRTPDPVPAARATLARRLTVEAAEPACLRISYVDDDPQSARRGLRALLSVVEPDSATADTAASPVSPAEAEVEVARLTEDLEAARALRAAQARELAEVPPTVTIEGREGANPVRERFAVLLDQQDALIASLEQRLRTRAQAGRLRIVEPASAAVRTGRPGHRLLSLVLLVGLAAGAAAAALAARRDPRFDRALELQRAFALPVLGSIADRQRSWRWRPGTPLGLACLALLGVFATLLALEAFDLLATPVARAYP